MALRQLVLRKEIEQKRAALAELGKRDEEFSTRAAELEEAIGEAATEDDMATVRSEIDTLEADQTAHEGEKAQLSERIDTLEKELDELVKKSAPNKNEQRSEPPLKKSDCGDMTREDRRYLRRADIRCEIRESMKTEEVRSFYEALREAVAKTRALSGTELLIPQTVLDRIQILVGDYGKLYSEVDVVPLNGTARVILDGANPEGIWIEMCDPVQELSTSFSAVELDGYKVGGFIPVCNAILEDSMINLAMYVERKLALAIAKALDKAILLGTGAAGHQPMGIIPNLKSGNTVTLTDNETGGIFGSLFESLGLIDTGENSVGEIVAVMKRGTYYASVAPRLVLTNSGGTYTLPNIQNPNFAGLRVVFSQYMEPGKVLVGDFKKYLLSERAGVRIESSKDVRFIEDQTVFKGTARYDGKPVNLDDNDKTADWILAVIPPVQNP